MAEERDQRSIDGKTTRAITPVRSGTGSPSQTSVNADAISAGDFAYGSLGSGTAGGLGNAALLSTTTILPNTRRTQVSRQAMEVADRAYTKEMNLLSQFWSLEETSGEDYDRQKLATMNSQYQWELARNKLEEVSARELTNRILPADFSDGDLPSATAVDLSPSNVLEIDDSNADTPDIVVTANPVMDRRVRLRPREANMDEIYGMDPSSPLFLLRETNGVFFPYTPGIDFSNRADYSSMNPTHANTSYHTYTSTPAVQITITGRFSAQNLAEARYTLAAMHFFRTVTKMHFGEKESREGTAGLPPPVLILSGYGEFMFNDLNVVVQEFKMDLPDNVDYIEVDIAGSMAWVPSLTTFTLSCVVQNTPKQQREDFNFADFAQGNLMRDGRRGWI